MAIYPGAVVLLVPRTFRRSTERNRINLHTAAYAGTSLYGMFSKPTAACSHFYVREDGTVEQYIDTDRYSAADLDGNDATISIETWDGYTGRPGWEPPPWTAAQVNALVALCRWICATHNIPVRLAENSKVGSSSRGISWHRLGVDGAFPRLPDPRAGRLQRGGGMHYSSAVGKVCPGDARIAQIPGIVAAIGAPAPSPTPPPAPTPIPPEEDPEVLMGYPFIIRDTDQSGWTLVLSPTKQVDVPKVSPEERKALTDAFGQPRTVGAELAKRIRTEVK